MFSDLSNLKIKVHIEEISVYQIVARHYPCRVKLERFTPPFTIGNQFSTPSNDKTDFNAKIWLVKRLVFESTLLQCLNSANPVGKYS